MLKATGKRHAQPPYATNLDTIKNHVTTHICTEQHQNSSNIISEGSEKESQDLATSVLAASLLVVHDAVGRSKHEVTELPAGQNVRSPLLNVVKRNVITWGNHGTLVDATQKLDHDLATAMVVHNVEFTNVTMLLHTQQKFHNHTTRGPDQDVPLALLLSVYNGLEAIGQHAHANHLKNTLI